MNSDIELIFELRDGGLLLLGKDRRNADKLVSYKALPGKCKLECKWNLKATKQMESQIQIQQFR